MSVEIALIGILYAGLAFVGLALYGLSRDLTALRADLFGRGLVQGVAGTLEGVRLPDELLTPLHPEHVLVIRSGCPGCSERLADLENLISGGWSPPGPLLLLELPGDSSIDISSLVASHPIIEWMPVSQEQVARLPVRATPVHLRVDSSGAVLSATPIGSRAELTDAFGVSERVISQSMPLSDGRQA